MVKGGTKQPLRFQTTPLQGCLLCNRCTYHTLLRDSVTVSPTNHRICATRHCGSGGSHYDSTLAGPNAYQAIRRRRWMFDGTQYDQWRSKMCRESYEFSKAKSEDPILKKISRKCLLLGRFVRHFFELTLAEKQLFMFLDVKKPSELCKTLAFCFYKASSTHVLVEPILVPWKFWGKFGSSGKFGIASGREL